MVLLVEKLTAPITEDSPCGADLEDTQLLAAFDGYRLFGQMTLPDEEPNWREIREKSIEGLGQSKDLRLLAHLGSAELRIGGIEGFCTVLQTAGRWFELYPDTLYPRVDEDAILRRNALNCFADRMAIVESLRRMPFVSIAQLGAFGLRDFEVASGRVAAPEGGASPSEAHLNGALAAIEPATLEATNSALLGGIAALQQIDALMRESHGTQSAPDFDTLLAPLVEIQRILQGEIQTRADNSAPAADAAGEPAGAAGAAIAVGSIRSRDDAIRALDAVATYFRKNEPSSPVPIVVERAKLLIAKDFLELLADLAPDGLSQAKRWGPRDE